MVRSIRPSLKSAHGLIPYLGEDRTGVLGQLLSQLLHLHSVQASFALFRAPCRKQVPGGMKIAALYLSKGLLTHCIIVIVFVSAAPFQYERA